MLEREVAARTMVTPEVALQSDKFRRSGESLSTKPARMP
jgi:hypothetical protein